MIDVINILLAFCCVVVIIAILYTLFIDVLTEQITKFPRDIARKLEEKFNLSHPTKD